MAIANEFIGVESVDSGKTLENSPIKKFCFKLGKNGKASRGNVSEKKRASFDKEIERISRFYDDYALRTQDKIKKYENEKKEIIRKR